MVFKARVDAPCSLMTGPGLDPAASRYGVYLRKMLRLSLLAHLPNVENVEKGGSMVIR